MKNKAMIVLSTTALFIPLMTAAALAASGVERTALPGAGARYVQTKNLIAGSAAAPGKMLRVDRTQAQLTISAWEKNEVSVDATVEVSHSDPEFVKEFLDNTTMKLEAEAGGLVLRLTSPMDWDRGKTNFFKTIGDALRTGRWNLSYAARIEIRVPASQSLDVSNHFGNVSVSGVTGRLALRNESGEVRIEGCGGELKLENSFASVRVVDFGGPIDVRNESGEVRAERIAGRTDIRNSFKDVQFSKIGGPLAVISESAGIAGSDVAGDCRITSSFKTIDVRGVRGRLEVKGESSGVTVDDVSLDAVVESSFKPVKVTNVKGGLRLTSESAAVTAEDIGGDASIKSSFQSIAASRIRGHLTVDGESSAVMAEDIGGAVRVRNSFKNIVLRRTSGSITIAGESSSVNVEEIKALPPGSAIDIKTSFNPIQITLPAGIEVQGTAKTEFGKIITDIPVTLRDSGSAGGRAVSFGTGKGGVTLKLETSADITIRIK